MERGSGENMSLCCEMEPWQGEILIILILLQAAVSARTQKERCL